MSVVSSPLEHFLHQNLEGLPEAPTDKTDKPNSCLDLSVLSGTPREFLGRNQEIYLRHLLTTDKTDKKFLPGLSVVSSSLEHFLHKNLENLPKVPTDKIDKPNSSFDLPGRLPTLHEKLERTALAHEFEERVAIAEYDGQQSIRQAQRIAYRDAFITALTAIPYKSAHQGNWFAQYIKESQAWLVSQGICQPE